MPPTIVLPERFRRQLHSGRELVRRRRAAAYRTIAVDALEPLLEGGLRRGVTVELIGRPSSGRFALVLAALAAATGSGEAAALVDLGDALDPQRARAAGVVLDRLLWARPRTTREALASAEAILGCGMPLLAIDLGLPPLRGGRGGEAAWLRLARAARARDSALLVASPYRATGTAADVVIETRGQRAAWRGRGAAPCLLHRLTARLDLLKRRGRRPGAGTDLALDIADAVPDPDNKADQAAVRAVAC